MSFHQRIPQRSQVDYIGIPYQVRGRNIDHDNGLDCWGLVRLWYRDNFGVDLDSYIAEYQTLKERELIASIVERESVDWIQVIVPVCGDIVLWQVGQHWMHIGVMVREDSFLHVLGKAGSTMEKITSLRWKTRPRKFFRLPLK
ncbi:MAG: C40 family peptidase [Candidatus Peribacteraceae bacterium]|nr:C40 family peptidase [Candidatus Peribacteraceae bacterium]